jgi:hypothetical protein
MDCVVSPVDQRFPVAEDEFSTTDPPSQNVVGPPAVMVGAVGFGFTVTPVDADEPEEQPKDISSTVYEPVVVTVMDCVVSPVDHKFPVAAEEVKVTDPPSQNVSGPLAVIVGTAGIGFTVTLVAEAAGVEHPNPLDTIKE